MSTKSIKKAVAIEVEVRSAGAVQGMSQIAAETRRARESVTELDAATKKYDLELEINRARVQNQIEAQKKLAASSDKVGAASDRSRMFVERLGFAAHQVVGQTASFNQALQGVLATLGPYGIAIGAVVGTVYHFYESHKAAAEAAKKLAEETRKATAAAEDAHRQFMNELADRERRERIEDGRERRQSEIAKKRAEIADSAREDIEGLEEAIAVAQGAGAKTAAFEAELARTRIRVMREQAKIAPLSAEAVALRADADALARKEELQDLEEEKGKRERGISKEKKEQFKWSAELLNLVRMERNLSGISRASGDTRDVAQAQRDVDAAKVIPFIRRDRFTGEETRNRAASERDSSLRGIEIDKASDAGGEGQHDREIERIEARKQAQLDYYDTVIGLETDAAKKRELIEQRADAEHQATLARIGEEGAAREESAAKTAEIGKKVGDIAGSIAQAFITSGDHSAKGFAKAAAGAAKAEAITMVVLAISEAVQAAVSLARYDFPGAALHGRAAGKAAAGAIAIGAIAAGLGAAAGGATITKNPFGAVTGDNFGPGIDRPSNDAPSTSNSQKDTTPLSPGAEQQLQQSNSANAGAPSGSNVVVVNFNAPIQSLGAIDDQTGLKLWQGMQKAAGNIGGLGVRRT